MERADVRAEGRARRKWHVAIRQYPGVSRILPLGPGRVTPMFIGVKDECFGEVHGWGDGRGGTPRVRHPSRATTVNRCTGVMDDQPTTIASDLLDKPRVSVVPYRTEIRALTRTATVLFLLTFGVLSTTSAQEPEVAAEHAALSWLSLLDGEQYYATWNSAATLFKDQLSPWQWQQSASAARSPFGALRSRRLKSATYATSLPGAPDGEYVVLQFDSVFDHKAFAVETVTPMLDNGVWRVGGYFIR